MRLCGCVAVRLCGCAAMRLCGCAAVRLCGCVAVRLCGCAAGLVCENKGVWLVWCARARARVALRPRGRVWRSG
eukprot:640581-Prymnesium_polylepis.1